MKLKPFLKIVKQSILAKIHFKVKIEFSTKITQVLT